MDVDLPNTVLLQQSFVRFVYPFIFNCEHFKSIIEKAQNAKLPVDDNKILTVWHSAIFPKEDLLPHVSRYLNPRIEGAHPTAKIWDLNSEVLSSYHGLGNRADWKLHAKQSNDSGETTDIEIQFDFSRIQLTVFQTGVGFLTVETAPKSKLLTDWQNFIHFFRFINRSNVSLSATRAVGFNAEAKQQIFEAFFPFGEFDESGRGKFKTVICSLLAQLGTDCDEVFIPNQLLPYISLFVENSAPEDDLKLIYKLRNLFHSEQGKNPSPADLKTDQNSLIEYGWREWQIFSLDGGAFLAMDAPRRAFFLETLPDHLRSQYFLLFLLALQQRFALINYSVRIGEGWFKGDKTNRIAAFEQIREEFFDFTARGYFVQVMQREHHHRCYRRWQEVFQVEQFYQNVRYKIREMYEYLQAYQTAEIKDLTEKQADLIQAQERQINMLGILLALLFGVPSLIIGFLGINLNRITIKDDESLEWWQAAIFVGLPFIFGILFGLILFRRYTKSKS